MSGYQTGSVYCDRVLAKTFQGECEQDNRIMVKTHWPALDHEILAEDLEYYRSFDRALHLVRNPLDAIESLYHLQNTVHGDE